ncbi:hypothetical protein PT974_11694 [Cladobotryum mycophilum]|uniref:Uncharacterized protein n=1 Tax=Cladobotryum mycophilum TaxID=491253 RepID=A0ABR0S5W9_9HYPO
MPISLPPPINPMYKYDENKELPKMLACLGGGLVRSTLWHGGMLKSTSMSMSMSASRAVKVAKAPYETNSRETYTYYHPPPPPPPGAVSIPGAVRPTSERSRMAY